MKSKKKPQKQHPLADLYQRLGEIDYDLELLKPYEVCRTQYGDQMSVREYRQRLRDERSNVKATISALSGGNV